MKKIAILQSNYIPWKGYFDLIAYVDEFILFDDMQYTKRDWRNRNQIKTPQGLQWLTIPVNVTGRFLQRICDVEIADPGWGELHWKTLKQNYRRAPFFAEVAALLEPLYLDSRLTRLSDVNRGFIEVICGYLGIKTVIRSCLDFDACEGRSERLLDLCAQVGGDEYVSGPAAKSYLDEEVFRRRGVTVSWFDYAGYPEYPQLWGEFAHNVTIVDLLCNCGPEASRYMRYVS